LRRVPVLATLFLGILAAALFVWFHPSTPTSFTDGGPPTPAERGRTYRWNFDDAPLGDPPSDFAVALGLWKVETEGTAHRRARTYSDSSVASPIQTSLASS
jgi:hypothetical protein